MAFGKELLRLPKILIFWFLASSLAACGGGSDSATEQIEYGQDGSTTTGPASSQDTSQTSQDTSQTLLEQATSRMIEDGMNVPLAYRNPDQGFAASSTLAQEFIDRYDQAHNFIQSRIGGYPNWNTVITDEDGADTDNQAVFDLLEEIGFLNYSSEPWTTQRVLDLTSCLTGSAPNGHDPSEVGANYVRHSLCMLLNGWFESEYKNDPGFWDGNAPNLEFTDGEYYHRWLLDFGFLDLQYHEYFHHFQGAHKLTAEGTGDSANEPFDPFWWAEGSGQFAGWFYRDNWQDIPFLSYLNPNDPAYDNYWETRDWSIPTPNSSPPYESLQDHLDYMVATQNKSFFFAASQVQNSSNKLDGISHGFIPEEDNCEDWVAKDENTAYHPDDSRYQYEPGQFSCWAIMFVAGPHFLAYKSSWQAALRDIPGDYYELGFWGSVEKHTGLNKQEFFNEFNALLRSVDAESIDENYAPEGWKTPDLPMTDVVDFLNIDYYKTD